MLSPNDGSRIVLLPEDKQLIELAGWTEAEYREFVRVARGKSRIQPGTPVAALVPPGPAAFNPWVAAAYLIVGVALSLTASYLTRSRAKSSFGRAAEIRQNTQQGQNIVSGARYAPKSGFDSLQNAVELGSIVPLVYARREMVDGISYGGIRINTNLLWSQVLSLNGDQLLRAIYLVGEGDGNTDCMELDPKQFALGNNLLGTYELAKDFRSRLAIYYSKDGGRLVNSDHLAGMPADADPGNFSFPPKNGPDVYSVGTVGDVQGPNFCYAYKPSTQTSIGLYSWIGNGMGFRTNPSLRPEVSPSTRPAGTSTQNVIIVCNLDPNERAARLKMQAVNPGMSGLTSGSTTLAVGDRLDYVLSSSVSVSSPWTASGGGEGAPDGEAPNEDVNSSVASRQVGFDEAISVGELYKIGSAIAICTSRTQAAFASQADDGNQSVAAVFEVVRAGTMSGPPGTAGASCATGTSQIFRVSRGSFSTEYPCQVVEVGLRHTLGINIAGLTNVIGSGYTYDNIDGQACDAFNAQQLPPDAVLNTQNIVAGQVSVREYRFSFFRVRYRLAGTDDAWQELANLYGGRGETQQATYTYLRMEMPLNKRWEYEFEPISGWEVARGGATGQLWVLDPRMPDQSFEDNGVTVRFNGYEQARVENSFRIKWLDPVEPALEPGGVFGDNSAENGSMADGWARLAEAFVYEEVQTTVGGNPEWEIVYVNTIIPNTTTPNYDDLAIIGMNIRASREFSNLGQFSVYMNRGLGGFHDFPSVLRDLLTNDRYGVGEITSPEQIDEPSFAAATTYTNAQKYFYDGAITDQINIRQWGAEMARNFLLDLVISNGRFALAPLLAFDKPEDITGLFTAGNILEGSFELSYFDTDQRQAPRVAVRWRNEQTTGDLNNRGLFPVVRQVIVREDTTSAIAPIEQIDMSDFCTSEKHAIDRGKFECRFRRLSTHSVKFTTTADQASLTLGRCFRLGMETLTYDQPRNGYIAQDGTITSWTDIPDGSYVVVAWDGSTYSEVSISVTNGKSNKARGSVFCVADNISQTQTYKVQSLSFNEDGNIDVEAIHWPTDALGNSDLTDGWDDASNWDIEGQLN